MDRTRLYMPLLLFSQAEGIIPPAIEGGHTYLCPGQFTKRPVNSPDLMTNDQSRRGGMTNGGGCALRAVKEYQRSRRTRLQRDQSSRSLARTSPNFSRRDAESAGPGPLTTDHGRLPERSGGQGPLTPNSSYVVL
jgi:hypothetical protein